MLCQQYLSQRQVEHRTHHCYAVAAAVILAVGAVVATVAAGIGSGQGFLALGQINADIMSLPATTARVVRPAETTEQFYASQHPVYIRWYDACIHAWAVAL